MSFLGQLLRVLWRNCSSYPSDVAACAFPNPTCTTAYPDEEDFTVCKMDVIVQIFGEDGTGTIACGFREHRLFQDPWDVWEDAPTNSDSSDNEDWLYETEQDSWEFRYEGGSMYEDDSRDDPYSEEEYDDDEDDEDDEDEEDDSSEWETAGEEDLPEA